MGRAWPDQLVVDGQALIEAEAVLSAALPQEGCGLLLGTMDQSHWHVQAFWPCLNAWQPAGERLRRFSLDPREQLLAQRWARARQWRILGSLHSHPASPPEPSGTDGELAVRPCLMLIGAPADVQKGFGVQGPRPWQWRAWWLEDSAVVPPGACLAEATASGGAAQLEIPLRLEGAAGP